MCPGAHSIEHAIWYLLVGARVKSSLSPSAIRMIIFQLGLPGLRSGAEAYLRPSSTDFRSSVIRQLQHKNSKLAIVAMIESNERHTPKRSKTYLQEKLRYGRLTEDDASRMIFRQWRYSPGVRGKC